MKRRIAAALTAAIFVFGASACTVPSVDTSSPQETVTVVPSEPTAPDLQSPEELFPDVIRDNTDDFDQVPDGELVSLAKTMCDAWNDGASFAQLAAIMLDEGFSPRDAGFFIGAGTAAFCPNFSDQINAPGVNL